MPYWRIIWDDRELRRDCALLVLASVACAIVTWFAIGLFVPIVQPPDWLAMVAAAILGLVIGPLWDVASRS